MTLVGRYRRYNYGKRTTQHNLSAKNSKHIPYVRQGVFGFYIMHEVLGTNVTPVRQPLAFQKLSLPARNRCYSGR